MLQTNWSSSDSSRSRRDRADLSSRTAACHPHGEQSAFLSTALAERSDRRLALAIALISFATFLATVPFVRVPLPQVSAVTPIYEAALAINGLITASLLFAQFAMRRSRALLLLAC